MYFLDSWLSEEKISKFFILFSPVDKLIEINFSIWNNVIKYLLNSWLMSISLAIW